jgi:hypothetical protein
MARQSAGKTTETTAKRGRSGRKAEKARAEPSRGEAAVAELPERMPEVGESSTMTLAHDQIADRARAIWEQRGRPHGEDDTIWHEAEDELKREMGISR